jgi:hypothetical protein
LHLAVAELPVKFWSRLAAEGKRDTVTCLRSVLMKPEHLEWVEEVTRRLNSVAQS